MCECVYIYICTYICLYVCPCPAEVMRALSLVFDGFWVCPKHLFLFAWLHEAVGISHAEFRVG